MESALWTQGLRKKLEVGKKRHEFQADHGFRKWFKTRCEIAGMKSINIEILMGHSIGISDSYYRATEGELLTDYLKAVDSLTVSSEHTMKKEIDLIIEQSKNSYDRLESELRDREGEIRCLEQKDFSNSDAIAALAEKLQELSKQIDILKRVNH